VLLIEKNKELGKKLSITGGGRCNITNAEFDTRTLLKHYGAAEQFLYAPFAQFGVQSTFDFFTERGLPLIVEDRTRAFPKTHKATDVTQCMSRYVEESGVEVLKSTSVRGFDVEGTEITGVVTDVGVYRARAYILASGGASYAETGSTGEGISWLEKIGYTLHASNPNLVPLVVEDAWVKKASGTTLTDVRITFTQGSQKIVKQGNVLCTHFGLSGPLILNSAHEIKDMLHDGAVGAVIDLRPHHDTGALRADFQNLYEANPNKTLVNLLKEWFPKGVIDALCASVPSTLGTVKAHTIPKEVRHALIDHMKSLPLTVTGTMGYDWAVISDGGVDLRDIDTRTMQSKRHTNLSIIGDVLHINRPSGGYSLQLCWTTGWVAGDTVLKE